jgi:hypothetical protein
MDGMFRFFIKTVYFSVKDMSMICILPVQNHISYDMPHKKKRDESYFQSLFYLVFSLMGQFVQTEVKSATGRSDAVVKTSGAAFNRGKGLLTEWETR